ncbi:hypothetical protein PTI98_000230 [Pleurotus ostreatus]|nr:hypothetical protein PTI98_000230 [Pleurotus ostreatus]
MLTTHGVSNVLLVFYHSLLVRHLPNSQVLLLLTLGAAQQLSMVAADYNMSIDNFGERDILARLPTSFGVAFFLDLFNSPLVESFYFWRIYKLTDKLWPCAIGTVLSWLRCAGWTVFAAQGAKEGYSNFSLLDSHTWLLAITVGYGLVANICVASIMVVFLYQNRNTTFMRTKVIIDRLILYTVQTCLITGLGYGTTLVTFLTMKHTCGSTTRYRESQEDPHRLL